jgi:hypothetical protein
LSAAALVRTSSVAARPEFALEMTSLPEAMAMISTGRAAKATRLAAMVLVILCPCMIA